MTSLEKIVDISHLHVCYKWDKVFKNGSRKIYGRQPLKYLKGYCLLLSQISFSYIAGASLEPRKTSMMKLSCKNS